MTIGIVVAMQTELEPFLQDRQYSSERVAMYTVYNMNIADKDVYIVQLAHVGEICSASATQMLITRYGVDTILNFGVVGSLTQEASICDVLLVDSVVHYELVFPLLDNQSPGKYNLFDTVAIPLSPRLLEVACEVSPNTPIVRCASGDKFVEDIEVKNHLATNYDAQICDMELAGIVITAHLNGAEVLSVKAVSDSLMGNGEEYEANLDKACSAYVQLVTNILGRI